MTPTEIIKFCLDNLNDTALLNSWDESGIFYNPQSKLKRGIYVLTVKEKDGDNDKSSKLNRDEVYRVNIGVRKDTFIQLFGKIPKRPPKGGVIDMPFDFSEIDRIFPTQFTLGWVGYAYSIPRRKHLKHSKFLYKKRMSTQKKNTTKGRFNEQTHSILRS